MDLSGFVFTRAAWGVSRYSVPADHDVRQRCLEGNVINHEVPRRHTRTSLETIGRMGSSHKCEGPIAHGRGDTSTIEENFRFTAFVATMRKNRETTWFEGCVKEPVLDRKWEAERFIISRCHAANGIQASDLFWVHSFIPGFILISFWIHHGFLLSWISSVVDFIHSCFIHSCFIHSGLFPSGFRFVLDFVSSWISTHSFSD